LAEDIETVTDNIADDNWQEGDARNLQPLRALLLDAEVRYGLQGDELLEHLFSTLRAPSQFQHEEYDKIVQ
jgi:hypothetical protein